MLDRTLGTFNTHQNLAQPNDPRTISSDIDLGRLFVVARRQLPLVILIVLLTLAAAAAYIATARPLYTASVTILIDSRRNQDQIGGTLAELTIDTGAVDSQLEVIRSDKVALSVVNALKLNESSEFIAPPKTYLQTLVGRAMDLVNFRAWMTSPQVEEWEESERRKLSIVRGLQDNLSARRVGRTYVMEMSYTSASPARAMQVANAFADAYFRDQLESRYEITRRASGWLQDRIAELKESALQSDLAVQRFKADKGIIATNSTSGIGQVLVADQQLTEITTQLSTARAETSKAEAKLQQIRDIIKTGRADGAVTESLDNPLINDFRGRYLRASKSANELTARLGANHYQVKSLKNEMAQYERLIFDELQRIAKTYVSEVEIARSREKSLTEGMTLLVDQKAMSNETMVQLRELEREADVFKNLYQTFLQRYQDAVQRESLPTTEARILSQATMPTGPSAPKPARVLALAGVIGLTLAGLAAFVRERRDRVFRTGDQVREELSLEFLGAFSKVKDQSIQTPASNDALILIAPTKLLRHSIDHPMSQESEVLRRVKVEADIVTAAKHGAKIIGVASVFPKEGKTTTSKNLASLLGVLGMRTLLIDGDLRNPGLTRSIAGSATTGLLEVLKGEALFSEAVQTELDSNLRFLPTVVRKRLTQSSTILSSPELRALLQSVDSQFDYIVVDLPPVGPVVDVRAAGGLFDCFVFVVEWGKTPRSLVRDILAGDPVLYEKCVGVLFNKVDLNKMKAFDKSDSKYYHYGQYASYYNS